MSAPGSPAARRRLAAELRRLRGNQRGREVSRALGWSPSKISRYEAGQARVPPDELEKLLDFYRVPDPEHTQLLDLGRDASQKGWWEDYSDAIPPDYQTYIGLEEEAASASQWMVDIVPGLLQTEDYARRLFLGYQRIEPIPPGIVERRVEVRMRRQEILTRDSPPNLAVVIDEAVLHRRIGDSQLMAAQLRHLLELADRPNCQLRVLPLSSERPIVADSFVIFTFNPMGQTAKLHDVVSAESLRGELFIEDESETFLYRLVFDSLAGASLSPADSQDLIQRIADGSWT